MIEEWKDIADYEYQVSNLGRVRSLKRNIIMKPRKDKYGYLYVNLYNKVRKTYKVHQLVAMAFLNHNPCGMDVVVDHINNIKDDNRLVNLQLISCELNNQKDKKSLGLTYHRTNKRWVVRIKGKWIGSYKTKDEAIEEHKKNNTLYLG